MKLYELTAVYTDLLNLDIEEQDLDMALESLQGTVAEKAEGIAMVMRTLEAETSAYKAEIDRLNELKKKAESKQTKLKKYLSDNLQSMQIDKLDAGLFKISFRKSSSVNVIDLDKVPQEFKKEKVTVSADKTALKKALKDGDVEGVELVENKNIQIK